MPATYTPVRYPGGKTKLYDFVRALLEKNALLGGVYCEPFAGGAGLALKLLVKGDVEKVIINDADPAIFAMWNAILNETDEICGFIEGIELSVDEWDRQKKIYTEREQYSELELAKATFYLNRTNVSGVITGGVIGGRDQKGKYKIDARFNRETLVKKIEGIAAIHDSIKLYNLDVIELMDQIFPGFNEKTFVNFDPPYVNKGGELYKNAFTVDDHTKLRDRITQFDGNWIVTYDVCDLIETLYKDYRSGKIDVYYSANDVRRAEEYVIYSDRLLI